MIIIFFFLSINLFIFYLILKFFEPRFKVLNRLEIFVNTQKFNSKIDSTKSTTEKSFLHYIILNFKNTFKKLFSKKLSSNKEENIEKKLLQAGNPLNMSPIDFYILKIILNIVLTLLFGFYGNLLNLNFMSIIILSLIGFVLSLVIPTFYINQKIKQRHSKSLKELPDFLDILTVCLEAGLGFDSAINKIISKKVGILPSEFHIYIEEIRLGKTRKDALTGIKERLNFNEMTSLINSILQSEKLGISIVHILRVKSKEERDKRKQRAEEEALKSPIKILFPLVLFIFPSLFIILLGPAVIQLISNLGK